MRISFYSCVRHPATSSMATLPTTEIPLSAVPTARSIFAPQNVTAQFPTRQSLSARSSSINHVEKIPAIHRPAGKRRTTAADPGANPPGAPKEEHLNYMGKLYERLGAFSIATRYALYILPLGIILFIPIIIGATVATNDKIGGIRVVWFFTCSYTMLTYSISHLKMTWK